VLTFQHTEQETVMSQRNELLDLERRKLDLLRTKIAEQERRVKLLETIDVDALLERELGLRTGADQDSVAAPSAPKARALDAKRASGGSEDHMTDSPVRGWQPRLPRRVPPTWIRVLRFLGQDGKSYDEVIAFIEANGLSLTPGAARTQLMNYRKEFGFIENPRKGFYKATERALAFLNEQEGKGAAVADSSAFDGQPAPLVRAEA
jgi:hypothetical protein